MTITQLSIYLLAAFFGIGLHLLKKLQELEAAGTIMSPWAYLKERPYASSLMALSAVALSGLWVLMGDLVASGLRPNDYALSFLTGFTCNSAYDTLRARAEAKIKAQP